MENESILNQNPIDININYEHSFLFQNEKGLWLILNVIVINMTDEPQLTGYAFIGGKLCENIKMPAPKVQKGKHIFPLSPKTVTATFVDKPFQMEPKEEREDTLVITNLEEDRDWHVGIGENSWELVKKEELRPKAKLDE